MWDFNVAAKQNVNCKHLCKANVFPIWLRRKQNAFCNVVLIGSKSFVLVDPLSNAQGVEICLWKAENLAEMMKNEQ